MGNTFSIGKKDEGWGKIDFSKLKSGITKQDLGIEEGSILASIFDSINTNQEGESQGKLDRKELNAFMAKLQQLCGKDTNLSEKEAAKFELADGKKLGKKNRKEVMTFLAKLSVLTAGIEKVTLDGNSEIVEYSWGVKEEIFDNGGKIITEKRGEQAVVTTYINNVKAQEVIKHGTRTITITYEDDGKTPKEKEEQYTLTEIDSDGNETTWLCTKREKYDSASGMYNLVSEVRKQVDNPEIKIIEAKDNIHNVESVYTDGQNLSSKSYVTLGEEPVTMEYDEDGNTLIIVQPDERNPESLAKKFGCSKESIIALNDNRAYFNVGEKIKIPTHIEPNDEIMQDRLSPEDAVEAFEEQKRAEEQARLKASEQVLIKGNNGFYVTRDANGKLHYYTPDKREITPESFKEFCPTIYENVNKTEEEKIAEKKEAYRQKVISKAYAADAATRFYWIYEANNGNKCCEKMLEYLKNRVDTKNIVDFIDAANHPATRRDRSSIIDLICDIKTASRGKREKVLTRLMQTLSVAAYEAGVSYEDRTKAECDFYAAMNDGLDVKKMETAMDFLLGCIAAKQTANVDNIYGEDAMKSFNDSNAVRQNEAQGIYNEAKGEGWSWTAKTGDWVCGLFGCKTIEEMEAKLGKSAADVKRLAQAKSYDEFKTIYKEIFGIEFDKNKIAAREAALENYQQAKACLATLKVLSGFRYDGDYASFREQVKAKLKLDDATIDKIVANYSQILNRPAKTDQDKKMILIEFISKTQEETQNTFAEITNGKTVEQLARDLELVHKSAFGTSDLANEVAEFTNNMAITEMVTEGVFEIAGTVALQFVPGLGQAAASRLAASTARWGAKGLKIAKAAQKAQKAFSTINKASTANNVSRAAASAVNTAAATMAVDLSNGDSIKDSLKKAFTNASFAMAGVTASVLAPKIMQAFGITNKALAVELAEEILNAAAAAGITFASGSDYGSMDAFIDIATGVIMARAGHIKLNGNKVQDVNTAATKNNGQPAVSTGSQSARVRAYSDMNEQELFTEYQNCYNKIYDRNVSNSEKAASINEIKKIKSELEKRGFKVENNVLQPITKQNTNTQNINTQNTEVLPDLKDRLGRKLYRTYRAIERSIEKLQDLADFNKIKNHIETKFAEFTDVAAALIEKLKLKAKQIGLKHSDTDFVNTVKANSDIRCLPNNRMKVNRDTHIRLADKVDIDLRDLEYKLNSMRDGDSFLIGREVNGRNDIRINNAHVSAAHIRVEKINGEIYITDLSSTNGTVLNTTKPDYAAQWKPGLRNKFTNARQEDFMRMCDENYDNLRRASYSDEESLNSNIRVSHIDPKFRKFKYAQTMPSNGWSFRIPNRMLKRPSFKFKAVDRISLNVKADKHLLEELDRLFETGEYINKQGKKVKIQIPDEINYKTPATLAEWSERHDPITIYFGEKASKELEDAIAEITEKYARKSCNDKSLMNSLEGKPWIAHEAYVTAEEAKSLYEEAYRLNPELASGIIGNLTDSNGNWNASTGGYAAAKKLVDEYKMAMS